MNRIEQSPGQVDTPRESPVDPDVIRRTGENDRPIDAIRFEDLDPSVNPRTRDATRLLYGGTFLHEPSPDNLKRLRPALIQFEGTTRREAPPSGRVSRLLRDVVDIFLDAQRDRLRPGRTQPGLLTLNEAGRFLAPSIQERLGTRAACSAVVERMNKLEDGIEVPCYEITAWQATKKGSAPKAQLIFDVATATGESILVVLARLAAEQGIQPSQVTVASLYASPCAVERLHQAGVRQLVVGELVHGVSPLGSVLLRTPGGYRHAIGDIDQWIETREPFLRLHGLLPVPELP